jgi:Tfp pilus assembly protein PilO
MIWREKRVLLILLAAALLANTMFFFTYRVRYQSRLDELDARVEEVQSELQRVHNARVEAEQTFQSYRKVEGDVLSVFNDVWSTQPQRFTALVSEVKRLTVASDLVPTSISFSRGDVKKVSSGTKRQTLGASEVGISFGVKGSYQQARRLINLLELSRQFVIISAVSLSGGGGDDLSLTLQLKTLFRDEQPGVVTSRQL